MKPRRSWTAKNRMEMIRLSLNQQLEAMKGFYPNYAKTVLMLQGAIESFDDVEIMKGRG